MNRREFGQTALAALCIPRHRRRRRHHNDNPNNPPTDNPTDNPTDDPTGEEPSDPSTDIPEVDPAAQLTTTLWQTNYDAGNLQDWSRTVGSVSSGGNYSDSRVDNLDLEINMSTGIVHAGHYGVQTKIKRAINKSIGIRLLRWRDDAGKVFPTAAYYSTWMYIPHNYITSAGWWNVNQFKSQRPDGSTSDPILTGNLRGNGTGYNFYFYDHIKNKSYSATTRFAAGRWVHLEVWYQYSVTGGAVKYWQDGNLLINLTGLQTKKTSTDKFLVWGIGNYTSGITGHPDGPGIAEVFFDDTVISTVRRGIA